MTGLLLIACVVAWAQDTAPAEEPPDVVQFLRDVGSDLANAHPDPVNEPYVNAQPFLDHFDSAMPNFPQLRQYVEELTARAEVASVIEVVSDSGDGRKREMQLDWVLQIQDKTLMQDKPPRRELVKCTIEKKGKKWKFVAFTPIELFKY